MWHGYVGFEDLNLNASQRAALWDAFRNLSPAVVTSQPKHLNQFRLSLDNSQAICELLFDDDVITIAAIKNRLATLFSVNASLITVAQNALEYGWSRTPFWTFGYSGLNYFRVAVFGGLGADWLQSRDAALDYVTRNIEDWESGLSE